MAKDLQVVQTEAVALRDYLHGDNIKGQLEKAMPKWMSVDRMLRVVFTSVMRNPKLLECSKESILSSVMQCAQLGLEPVLGRAYLIPYNNRKNVGGRWIVVPECQMQVGYQGFVDLARRTDTISDVWSEVVYENDVFELSYGMDRNLVHVPWFMDRKKRAKNTGPGEMLGAYVIWQLKDGTKHPEFMAQYDIHRRRELSQAYKWAETGDPKKGGGKRDSVWHTWPEEQSKKTVVKHSAKLIPMSIEFMQAVELDQDSELGLEQITYFDSVPKLPEPVEKDLEGRFAEIFAGFAPDVHVTEFLEITAQANETSVRAIMESAIENVDSFKNSLTTWISKKTQAVADGKTTPPKKDPPKTGGGDAETDADATAFINEWLRLHEKGYREYVLKNLDRFGQFPDWVLKKAQEKWKAKIGEPWPEKSGDSQPDSGNAESSDAGEGDGEVDIYQSDEWNELSMIQSQYPDVYKLKVVSRNLPLKTIEDLKAAIESCNKSISAGDDIPW